MAQRFSAWSLGLLVLLVVIAARPLPSAANPVATENVRAQLISEVTAIRSGAPFWLALHLDIRDGWHTYWRNPGDSGLATTIEWSLPQGFTVGDIHWPYPEHIPVGPLMNYGYHGEVYLLIPITPPDELPADTPLTLTARADWLVCQEDCIPETATLHLTLPVTTADSPRDSRWAEVFAMTRRALPGPSPWPVTVTADNARLVLTLNTSGVMAEDLEALHFFPYRYGVLENAAPQPMTRTRQAIQLELTRGELRDIPPQPLRGVLVAKARTPDGLQVQAVTVSAPPVAAAVAGSGDTGFYLGQALILALLGGLLLNLMPCVFPVLSMKALSIVQHGRAARSQVRRYGLAYTAGVLVCFTAIAGVLLALRAAGTQIGWGFQLQSPVFVMLLAYLFFVLGLSLSGVFTVGNTLMDLGSGWTARPGYRGSFATGALAVVAATPCTAPLMGTAMGFALTQPWPVALTVFLALGLGLALPYLLLCFCPPLLRMLPKPGPWLTGVKEFLAFPLYATVIWLVWVLSQQAGPHGVALALSGLLLIVFAIWLYQRLTPAGGVIGRLGKVAVMGTVIAALGLAALPAGSTGEAALSSTKASSSGPAWEPFSRARLDTLRAGGRPVFVNMTAAWCITCLVNERVVLRSAELARRFADKGVVYLKGDWTNRNPEITQFLSAFGRSGVPLYVLYPPLPGLKPMILPQLLSEATLLRALETW